MKFKFWSFLFISVFFPLLVICVWGVYFIQSYENQIQEKYIKETVKQEQSYYFKSLDSKLLLLEDKIQQAFEKQEIDDKSPLIALMVLDRSQKKIIEKYFWNSEDSPFKKESISNQEQLVSFVEDFKTQLKDSVQFDVFSLGKKNKMNMIVLEGNRFFFLEKQKTDGCWAFKR